MALVRFCTLGLLFSGAVLGRRAHKFPKLTDSGSKLISLTNSKNISNDMTYYAKRFQMPPMREKVSTAFMMKLFNVLQSGSSIVKAAGRGNLKQADLTLSDTIRSFAPTETPPSRNKMLDLQFKIPNLPNNERLRLAEVRCLLDNPLKLRSKKLKMKIDILKGDNLVKKLTMRGKPITQANYDVYDVSHALTPLINGYHGNVTISMKVQVKHNNSNQYMLVLYLENHTFLKNMVESYMDGEHKSRSKEITRTKRSTRDRKLRHKNRRWNRKALKRDGCHMYDFDVNFNTIGWGQWIIHPARFNAKVCDGKCFSPTNVHYKPTNHAILQSLMRTKRQNAAPTTCCVPTKLEPLSMMYFEYDEIVVRHHDDMIAAECGCR